MTGTLKTLYTHKHVTLTFTHQKHFKASEKIALHFLTSLSSEPIKGNISDNVPNKQILKIKSDHTS